MFLGIDFNRSLKCDGCSYLRRETYTACQEKYEALQGNTWQVIRQCYYTGLFGRDFGKFSACKGRCKCAKLCEERCKIGPRGKKDKHPYEEKREAAKPAVPSNVCPSGRTFGQSYAHPTWVSGSPCGKCLKSETCRAEHEELANSDKLTECLQGKTFGADFDKDHDLCYKRCSSYQHEACKRKQKLLAKEATEKKKAEPVLGKRHIQLEVVSTGANTVTFKVTAQSHRADNFCSPKHATTKEYASGKPNTRRFVAKDGYEIRSSGAPGYYGDVNSVYLRGGDAGKDNYKVTMPSKEFQRAVNAVAEYNEVYKDSVDGNGTKKESKPSTSKPEKWVPKVGDLIVAKPKNGYGVITNGWEGVVVNVVSSGNFAAVSGDDPAAGSRYSGLDPDDFTLSEKKSSATTIATGWVPKVGDLVVGLEKASTLYSETIKGWKGKVVQILDKESAQVGREYLVVQDMKNGVTFRSTSRGQTECGWPVDPTCFKKIN